MIPILTTLLSLASLGATASRWPQQRQQQQQQHRANDHGSNNFRAQCASLDPAAVGIANATVTNHAFVAAGTTLNLTGNDPSCALASQAVPVDLCRVALEVATSGRSGVLVEVWLPARWSGRLVTTGNGGLGGCQ